MRRTSIAALVPGAYLVATRYPGFVQVGGFVWLEMVPLTSILLFWIGSKALLAPVLHWLFLGLYELGYVVNDRADTAIESPARPGVNLGGRWLVVAVIARLVFLLAGLAFCRQWLDAAAVGAFLMASGAIVLLLFVHTFLGVRRSSLKRLRIASFAGLAFGKYAPAALALASFDIAIQALGWIFLLYGAGRTVDYGLVKVLARRPGMIGINALWYLAVLLPAIALIYTGLAIQGAIACLGVFGVYHLLMCLKRGYGRFAGNV